MDIFNCFAHKNLKKNEKSENFELTAFRFGPNFIMFSALEFFADNCGKKVNMLKKACELLFHLIINLRMNNNELNFYGQKTESRSI